MAIVKIRHRGASSKNHEQQNSRASIARRIAQEEGLLIGRDACDDLDDSDLADVGCELATVGDQTCNIPYDLYDLSDVKEILSLDSWNSCLTEDERFKLAAYLPDVDQETFVLTIKELLSGDNLFFGSPLEKLFHRLKAGFFSLQVTPMREGLRYLQKLGHYHSLRSYHEGMTQKFVHMRRVWSNCISSATVEERIRSWNKREDPKPVLLVDLNAIPADEETLVSDKKPEDFPLFKKKKCIDEGCKPLSPAFDLSSVASNAKTKGKGVLKVRPIEMSPTLDHRIQVLPSESWDPSKRMPKGVLKIMHKSNPFGQPERPITFPVAPGHTNNWREDEFLNVGARLFNNSQHFSRKMLNGYKDQFDVGLSTTTDSTIVTGDEKKNIVPITYKRTKESTKFTPNESVKQQSSVVSLDPVVPSTTECKLIGKAKTVKIKFKGWNNRNA